VPARGPINSVGQQVTLYVFARVALGLAQLAAQEWAAWRLRRSTTSASAASTSAASGSVFPTSAPASISRLTKASTAAFSSSSSSSSPLPSPLSSSSAALASYAQHAAAAAAAHVDPWAVFAGLSWACVMHLFRWHPDVLQPGMRSSMVYM
jgi:hypothetical protein